MSFVVMAIRETKWLHGIKNCISKFNIFEEILITFGDFYCIIKLLAYKKCIISTLA